MAIAVKRSSPWDSGEAYIEPPALATAIRFSTLWGYFSVSDALEFWDVEPTAQWQEAHTPTRTRREQRRWELLQGRNFEKWIITMESILRKLGLWNIVKYPHLANLQLEEDWEEEWPRNDTWATNILLMHIHPATLARYDLQRPITSHQLICELEKGPKPFRLLDLPREIREEIIRFAVVAQPYKERQRIYKGVNSEGMPKYALRTVENPAEAIELLSVGETRDDKRDAACKPVPALLWVSHQIRDEAIPIYFGENKFCMRFVKYNTCNDPIKEMKAWAEHMSAEYLIHISDLELQVDWSQYQSFVDVKYDPERGLVADVLPVSCRKCSKHGDEEDEERAKAYLAMMEQRRRDEKWRSKGVWEYFTADEFGFKKMLWGPPFKWIREPEYDEEGEWVECDLDDPDVIFGPW